MSQKSHDCTGAVHRVISTPASTNCLEIRNCSNAKKHGKQDRVSAFGCGCVTRPNPKYGWWSTASSTWADSWSILQTRNWPQPKNCWCRRTHLCTCRSLPTCQIATNNNAEIELTAVTGDLTTCRWSPVPVLIKSKIRATKLIGTNTLPLSKTDSADKTTNTEILMTKSGTPNPFTAMHSSQLRSHSNYQVPTLQLPINSLSLSNSVNFQGFPAGRPCWITTRKTYHKFHIASSRSLGASSRYLLTEVCSWYDPLSQSDAVVLQEDTFQSAADDRVAVHSPRHIVEQLNDQLRRVISRRGLHTHISTEFSYYYYWIWT